MKKSIFKNLVLIMMAVIIGAGLLFTTNLTAGTASASTPISHQKEQQSQSQNIIITSIVDENNTSKSIYLYPHSTNDANSIYEFFAFYGTKNSGLNKDLSDELVYDKGYDGGGPSSAVPYNGEFSSILTLSKNIQIAIKKGYVEISSSAMTTSKAYSGDNADKITSGLFIYDSTASSQIEGETFIKKESTSTRNDSLEIDAFTVSASDLAGLILDTIELNFKSSLNNKILFSNHNYMRIVSPMVMLSTSDAIAPSLEISCDNAWTQSRNIKILTEDYQSGLQKVEYKIDNGEWIELANYSEYVTSDELSIDLNKNGTVYVKTTDNVGNVNIDSYTEENIDTTAPNLNIDIDRDEFDMSFDISVTQTGLESPEKYNYTVKINGGAESSRIELLNGLNHFDCTEAGEYEFTFYAEDEAGNSMTPITKVLVFKKLLEISSITDNYVYEGGVINFVYSPVTYAGNVVSESELLTAGFNLKITQNGESVALENAGTYDYVFSCNNQYYLINYSGTIVVSPYNINFVINNDTFEYSSEAIYLDYEIDKNVELSVVYKDSLNNVISVPTAVGSYFVEIKYTTDGNYVLNETATLTITKRSLIVSADAKTITYGEVVGEFTYTVSGTLAGDTLKFDIICDYTTDAGEYLITFKQKTVLSENEEKQLENYNITFNDAIFKILKKTAYIIPNENQSKLYFTQDPVLTYTVSGLINGDSIEGVLLRESGEDAGFYQFELGTLSHKNYELVLIPSSFQITKRVAYIILSDTTKTYGDADPIFTFNFETSGVLSNDIKFIQNCITREVGENIGTYKVSIDKNAVKNYVLVLIDSYLTIEKRNLTIVADDIFAEYGDEKPLTYTCDNLADGDALIGSLSRVNGTALGEYDILQGTLSNDNYNITFVPAKYTISQKQIKIVVTSTSKLYGEVDDIKFEIIGTDKVLPIKVLRELGEDVGTYVINNFEFDDSNYIVEFVSGTLEILPAQISVSISDANKTYGEADPEFVYEIFGLTNGENINLNIVRELGENAGSYKIMLGENNLKNYQITLSNEAVFEIKKADLVLNLSDKIVTYSGKAFSIDEIDTEFEISYVYTLYGLEIEPANVINAREYKVQAFFAGNENFNASKSNIATLLINKKLIPVTLKKTAFNYNGEVQVPEFDINFDEDVSLLVSYVSGITEPVEVGEYDFVIVSNDANANYVCDFKGTLTIFEGFYSNSGDANVVADRVGLSSLGIHIFEDKSSSLRSSFNALRDGRKCVSVYTFETVEGYESNGEVFTVSIKANAGKDVKIYCVDANGKMSALSYTIANGCYVLSVNDISVSILVTASDNTMFFSKVISVTVILILCYFITTTVRKQKRNNFYRRNTTVKYSDYNELKENENIVEISSFNADIISGNDFIDSK